MAWFGEAQRADLPGAGGDQLAAFVEVSGEEQREQDLGELAGLERQRPDTRPRCRAPLRVLPMPGTSGASSSAGAEDEEGPFVAGQVWGALHEQQRQRCTRQWRRTSRWFAARPGDR